MKLEIRLNAIDAKFHRVPKKKSLRKEIVLINDRPKESKRNSKAWREGGGERRLILRYSIRASIQSSPVIRYRGQRTYTQPFAMDRLYAIHPAMEPVKNDDRRGKGVSLGWMEEEKSSASTCCARVLGKFPTAWCMPTIPRRWYLSPLRGRGKGRGGRGLEGKE